MSNRSKYHGHDNKIHCIAMGFRKAEHDSKIIVLVIIGNTNLIVPAGMILWWYKILLFFV